MILLLACESECLGEGCEDVPDIPWDPGDGDTGEAYGSGEDTDTGERTIVTTRSCSVTVTHTPDGDPDSVSIAGEWNGWTPEELDPGDPWSMDLGELEPGEYGYKFLYDGAWEGDPPATAYAKWVDGGENRNLRVGDCERPLLQTVSAGASSDGSLSATIQVALAADGSPLASVVATVGDVEVTPVVDAESGLVTIDVTGLAPGKHSLRVWATDAAGRSAENEPLWVPLWVEDEPFAWTDGLLYFVFVDRFRNGDWGVSDPIFVAEPGIAECANWNGGDYLGVIDAIEEGWFEELGVRTIWLSPATQNPEGSYLGTDGSHWFTGYHGYWPTDAGAIEDRYGDTEAEASERLRELIDTAHAHGIRVLFDLVMNHVHEDHSYVSEHPEWFGGGCVCGSDGCGWDEYARECWFTS